MLIFQILMKFGQNVPQILMRQRVSGFYENQHIFFRDMLSPDGTTKISHCPTLGWIIS